MYPSYDEVKLNQPPIPTSRVGSEFTDHEAPGMICLVVWDPTYKHPLSWGHTHGLLMVDEGQPYVYSGTGAQDDTRVRSKRRHKVLYLPPGEDSAGGARGEAA